MDPSEFSEHLKNYRGNRRADGRFASFDYCFNYFQSFRDGERIEEIADDSNMETSCLQIGFYLASWGMYRGSSQMLQHSCAALKDAVRLVASAEAPWGIDVTQYRERGDEIIGFSRRLRSSLSVRASDTLVTKIMLGVFGCVPALDRFVKRGLGVSSLSTKSLSVIERWHGEHQRLIENANLVTIDFTDGSQTDRKYTDAKIIDMVMFMAGQP